MAQIISITLLLCVTSGILNVYCEEYKIINTNNGLVRGRRSVTVLKNISYYSFKGIPYAKPPIDELRFKVIAQIDSMNQPNFLYIDISFNWYELQKICKYSVDLVCFCERHLNQQIRGNQKYWMHRNMVMFVFSLAILYPSHYHRVKIAWRLIFICQVSN